MFVVIIFREFFRHFQALKNVVSSVFEHLNLFMGLVLSLIRFVQFWAVGNMLRYEGSLR